jgi:hypothetical protein
MGEVWEQGQDGKNNKDGCCTVEGGSGMEERISSGKKQTEGYMKGRLRMRGRAGWREE